MTKSMIKEYELKWTKDAAKILVGRTIVSVRYTTDKETKALGWRNKSLVFLLDNGLSFYPSSDNEGNNAGTIFTTDEYLETIPLL